MKFRIDRDTFADAVAWTARSLPNRPSVPVLAGLMIETSADGLTLSGFDYETSTRATLPAEVADDGKALVSGRLLAEIVKSLPAKPVDVSLDGTKVQVVCGSARFSLQTMPVEEYPQLPEMPTATGTVKADEFATAVAQASAAAGRDEMLPLLTGVRGQHTGTTDLPLTEDGEERAAALRERIGDRRFALVATSPLQRARRTCELAGLAEGAEVIDDLRELDYGRYEGRTTVEIREERPGWTVWRDGSPGGERLEDAGVRADRVIERALAADGDVALFGHGHFLRVIGARWIGLPAQGGSGLALGTAALCDLGFERERRVIWLWNQTG